MESIKKPTKTIRHRERHEKRNFGVINLSICKMNQKFSVEIFIGVKTGSIRLCCLKCKNHSKRGLKKNFVISVTIRDFCDSCTYFILFRYRQCTMQRQNDPIIFLLRVIFCGICNSCDFAHSTEKNEQVSFVVS